MTLKAMIGEREIASKVILSYSEPDFKRRVQNHERIVKEEISRVKMRLNGKAARVTFIITAQSKMNKL